MNVHCVQVFSVLGTIFSFVLIEHPDFFVDKNLKENERKAIFLEKDAIEQEIQLLDNNNNDYESEEENILDITDQIHISDRKVYTSNENSDLDQKESASLEPEDSNIMNTFEIDAVDNNSKIEDNFDKLNNSSVSDDLKIISVLIIHSRVKIFCATS